jgi:NAD(P)-dependent dehydrogenase (short-subunit alcohol dehydrogenase family)
MSLDTQLYPAALGTAPACGRLDGRRVLIVGAGQRSTGGDDDPIGNGRAMSVLFAREGAALACADANREAADATVTLITGEGGKATAIEADITAPDQIERMITQAHEAMGGLDGLVINVGIGAGQQLPGLTAEVWDYVMAANLRGHMLTARAALPLMEDGAAIVFISSIAAHMPASREPVYETSKAGLLALSRAVALEGQRRGIRSNVVSPGLIDTPLGRVASAGRPNRAARPLPFGRQGTGWEVAHAALFLISTEASYVNAHELIVDGGLLCGVARQSKL